MAAAPRRYAPKAAALHPALDTQAGVGMVLDNAAAAGVTLEEVLAEVLAAYGPNTVDGALMVGFTKAGGVGTVNGTVEIFTEETHQKLPGFPPDFPDWQDFAMVAAGLDQTLTNDSISITVDAGTPTIWDLRFVSQP